MLFQKTIIKKYLGLLNDEVVSEAWNKFQTYFLDAQIQANILQSKEEQFQEGFLRELFVNVLGYTLNPSPNYNLITEKKNETNSKKADGTKTGYVIQKINYYPFGAQFCDGSTDSNVQSHKYNGKEFDKMHGLNTYDYGARQYNPVTARWDRMDPLAEKYYSISPYVYCMNNPIIHVDPDGKEKKSYLSKEETQNSDYNLYPENTPGVLNIWAHGTKELKTDKYSWSIKVDRHYIDNATDLRRFVLCHCKEWINNQGRNIIIVLHACSSSNLAKIMSAQDIFKGKNITIIAPNAKLKKNRVGSVVNSKTYFDSDTKKVVGKEEGQWRVYKDGELINTLPADAQPGLTNKKRVGHINKR